MSKKDKPKAIDAPTSESVEVSMSPKERDEFVEFMRNKKDIEDAPKSAAGRHYIVHLIYKHHINGIPYGPGRVTIPEDIAGQVIFADEAQKQAEISLFMHKKRAYQLFQSGAAPQLVEAK